MRFAQFILVGMALLFLVHAGSKFYIYADFYLNQEYIAAELCENKDKPILKCNGKCQLMKSLEKDSERQQEHQGHQSKIEIFLYFEKAFQFDQEDGTFEFEEVKNNYFSYQDARSSEFHTSLLKPPTAKFNA